MIDNETARTVMFGRLKFLELIVTFSQNRLTRKLGMHIIKVCKENLAIGGIDMKKEEVLNASRKEHQNRDLAEIEVLYLAGSHASRVGALVCCILSWLSSMISNTMIYSPWVIYFSILSTQWFVRFIKMKKKSDLALMILFLTAFGLSFVGFIRHLLEVRV